MHYNSAAWAISVLLVCLTVLMHYEVMLLITDRILVWARRKFLGRRTMILIVFTLLLGHIAEIWLFAGAMALVCHIEGMGALQGAFDGGLNSYLYFSAVNYTSLGYGDIYPVGPIRALAVSETLAGLVMIAWSASFAYLKMEQIWETARSSPPDKRIKGK